MPYYEIRMEMNTKSIHTKHKEWATSYLKSVVAEYDSYLRNEVYGWVIKDNCGLQVDSCWGFYDYDDCEADGLSHQNSLR